MTKEYCNTVVKEYSGEDEVFHQYALTEYEKIKNGKYKDIGGGLTWKLIADDPDTLKSLTGDFSCYCEYWQDKESFDIVDILQAFAPASELEDACTNYKVLKDNVYYIKLTVTLFITGCNVISKMFIMWIISVLGFRKRSD